MKQELSKNQKKELIIFSVSFLFLILSVYSYMNIQPCGGFCLNPRPLLFLIFMILGIVGIITYLVLTARRLIYDKSKINYLYIIALVSIFVLSFMISYKDTFNTDAYKYQNKLKLYTYLHEKMHFCFLEKYFPYGHKGDDHCFIWWAEKFHSEQFCIYDDWSNPIRDICFKEIALYKKDARICLGLDRNRYGECIRPYISLTGDNSACILINDSPNDYKKCLWENNNQTPATCGQFNMPETECYNALAEKYHNASYCYALHDIKSKDDCLTMFVNFHNSKDCETYNITKDLCYYYYVVRNVPHDYSYCFRIVSQKYKNRCFFYASIGNNDSSTCNYIDDKVPFGDDLFETPSKSQCFEWMRNYDVIAHSTTIYWVADGRLIYKYD